MEYIIGIAVICVLGYLAFRMSKPTVGVVKDDLALPHKVETAPVFEEPAPVVVEPAPVVVEAPAKKPRKPRAPKVEQAPVKAPVAKTKKVVVANAPVKTAVKAVKAPVKKPAAAKATLKKA